MKVVLILACAATVASATLSVEGAAAKTSTTCSGLTGAKWKATGGLTGTKYFAGVRGVTCAFVKPWVARLSGLHKANATITGGPPGLTCRAAQRQAGEAFYGFTCYGPGKVFTVFPQV